MAVDNDTKLTKFKSATTIVTADYANSIFGGLYGSSEADNLHPDDPRIIGHVHDGVKADGHAGKIDLVDHVENQLLNINLADDAVTKRNVRETLYQSEAIPEYEIIDGVTYYYLDLTGIRTDFTFIEDDAPSSADSGISENILIRQRSQTYDGTSYVDIPGVWGETTGRDFVFGSPSLEDINDGTNGNSRFLFDKSLSAFRAGSVNSTQWDEANRGQFSAAFGINNTASGDGSFAAGFRNEVSGLNSVALVFNNTVSGDYSISIGEGNQVDASNSFAAGFNNTISSTSPGSVSLGENGSMVNASLSLMGTASNSTIKDNGNSVILSGVQNVIDVSAVPPVFGSSFPGDSNLISSGQDNLIDVSLYSSIIGGENNSIESALYSSILSGSGNEITGVWNFASKFGTTGIGSIIFGGFNNQINEVSSSTILSGIDNSISAGAATGTRTSNAILAGDECSIVDADYSIIEAAYDSKIATSGDVYDTNEIPTYTSVSGYYAFGYGYGQRVQASGTFFDSRAPLNTFGTTFPPPPNEWTILVPERGGAQTFTMTMFGNFKGYDQTDLGPPISGALNTPQTMIANLDNGEDFYSANRPFRPRINSSYSIKAMGTLSFSEIDPAPAFGPPRTIRHSVTFELHSGITTQEDGSILYNTDSFIITHDSRDLYGFGRVRLKAPGTTNPNDDFRIYFTHDTASPTNRSPGLIGPPALPPGYGFSFVVENRTFLNNGGAGTSSGSILYGEALSVRLDVTEININLYREQP